MPFVINQELCSVCSSCIGNCPKRAIIRRDNNVYITEMCSDCGMVAIRKGEVKDGNIIRLDWQNT